MVVPGTKNRPRADPRISTSWRSAHLADEYVNEWMDRMTCNLGDGREERKTQSSCI